MFKDRILKLKENFEEKSNGNNKKTIENIIVFIIILIVTIVFINYIWNGDKKNTKNIDDTKDTKTLAEKQNTIDDSNQENNKDDMTNNLEDILGKIKGVGNVKVLITYSKTSETIPMYSEDTTQKTTSENDSRWRNKNDK